VKFLRQELRAGLILACFVIPLTVGCVHKIHVAPSPPVVAQTPIPHSLRVVVSRLAVEGADHMPGITLFEWPAKDLRSATIDYIEQRRTFSSVNEEQGSFTLTIKTLLRMQSRSEYHYLLRLESDLGLSGKLPIKSYLIEKDAVGSSVRWVTASDQDPIAEAVQAALDDLFLQIEEDAGLYGALPN